MNEDSAVAPDEDTTLAAPDAANEAPAATATQTVPKDPPTVESEPRKHPWGLVSCIVPWI